MEFINSAKLHILTIRLVVPVSGSDSESWIEQLKGRIFRCDTLTLFPLVQFSREFLRDTLESVKARRRVNEDFPFVGRQIANAIEFVEPEKNCQLKKVELL